VDYRLKREIGKIEKLKNNRKFQCLYPDCSSLSIGSHSQQRGGQLKIISENDEVYCVNFNMYDALTKGDAGSSLVNTKIKNASIYPGFCQNHDGPVFSPVEKSPLVQGNNLQASTLFLRTLTYEITRKKLIYFATQNIIEKCNKLMPEEIISNLKMMNLGREKFIKHDLPFYLENSYKAYNNPDKNILKTKWVVIPKTIKASSCTVFSPMRDFQKRIEHQAIASPQILSSFNLIPVENETHVVVSWLEGHSSENEWIESAMDKELEGFINYIAICESEDICIGPELWDSVDVFSRERVYEAMQHEIYRGALSEIPRVIKI
jgi:hypothetical protein